MEDSIFSILRLSFFFIFLFVSLNILNATNIERFFRRSTIWQIQLFIIFSSIIMAYLVSESIVSLMETTFQLLG